jgi:hypothetical protein
MAAANICRSKIAILAMELFAMMGMSALMMHVTTENAGFLQ